VKKVCWVGLTSLGRRIRRSIRTSITCLLEGEQLPEEPGAFMSSKYSLPFDQSFLTDFLSQMGHYNVPYHE
jgi:hypothetical protein